MKIVSTALLLIVALLIVPLITYFFGTPLDPIAAHALLVVVVMAVIIAICCFVTGELTGNFSQVDKLWSLVPIAYTWTIAGYGDFGLRLFVMGVLVTIWGLRLTYNFSLKGAYQWRFWKGEEDYRWRVLRVKPEFQPRWKWTLFNLCFISGYQNALILMLTLPAIVALQFNDQPFGLLDYVAAALIVFFVGYESVADWQHWKFQSEKWALINSGQTPTGDYKKGFLDQGLWSRSRHPNYFAEQAIWICFYLFSISASGQWFNWSIAGSCLLVLLFVGSSKFSEEISASKYPQYKDYQRRVPRFIPRVF
jgi:steroid 5-alpha reductase family enzyme